MMFEGNSFPMALEEEIFEKWLEKGRESKIGYNYMLIVWDAYEGKYIPLYEEERISIENYEQYGNSKGNESLIAVYDLYSESRIL